MIFAPLPTGFPALEAQVQKMQQGYVASAPPPIADIGQHLRTLYAAEQSRSDYQALRSDHLRPLPYAYWVPASSQSGAVPPPLPSIHPSLVQRYWTNALPKAVADRPTRADRWLRPLFFVYCERFAPDDLSFREFAVHIRQAISDATGKLAEALRRLDQGYAFFTPQQAPTRLVEALISPKISVASALGIHLLWPSFVDSPLGFSTLRAALHQSDDQRRNEQYVMRLLEWIEMLAAPISKSPEAAALADALLLPWRGRRRPPDTLKVLLVRFFVHAYGDPRTLGHRLYAWRQVDPAATAVLRGWLAGDTLRALVDVLKGTGDKTWPYREKFWMAYYDAGVVQDAWLALGNQAATFARRLQVELGFKGYGRLVSGATTAQSVLLLKLGGLIFVEWSHNGALRAYDANDHNAPDLYDSEYHGEELRDTVSLDFHNSLNQRPQLSHTYSDHGTWQRTARDFIRRHTGVHLPDAKIL